MEYAGINAVLTDLDGLHLQRFSNVPPMWPVGQVSEVVRTKCARSEFFQPLTKSRPWRLLPFGSEPSFRHG
jgi:hypothetical protein